MSSTAVSPDRRRFYVILAALLAVWAVVMVVLALTIVPDAYWYSYYAVDYTIGFVRRGLAGELIHLIPGDNYFIQQRVGRWVSSGAFIVALAVLAWWIALKSGRSERRLQLAFLIAVLPFGLAFGLLSAGSTLFGGVAMIGFAVALPQCKSDRSILITSAVYGVLTGVAALVHEAIPLLFGLGAVAALTVLKCQLDRATLWTGYALALGPGLAVALVVAALGKHGVSSELCALVPHGQVNNPLAGHPTTGQLLSGYHYYVDYHDWACRNITPFYDRDFLAGIRYVGRLGPVGMIENTLFGIGIVVITILAIGWVSGVPFGQVAALLRKRWLAVLLGFFLIVPVFMTGIDWVRWWVMIAFDIGVVYLVYASTQPAVDAPPTRRSRRVFVLTMVLLAVIPIGIVPAFDAPLPI